MVAFLCSLLQRLFCCKRKRRPSKGHGNADEWSDDEAEAMLTSVTVENSSVDQSAQLQSWNSWPEEEFREPTVADRIEAYRSTLRKQTSVPDDPVEEVDFFTDMTPSVSRQARVYVGPSSKATPGASRLGVHGQADGLVEESLGSWDESSGWDAEDEGLGQLMREQRRQQKRLNSN